LEGFGVLLIQFMVNNRVAPISLMGESPEEVEAEKD
jgi:hypothetical protein